MRELGEKDDEGILPFPSLLPFFMGFSLSFSFSFNFIFMFEFSWSLISAFPTLTQKSGENSGTKLNELETL